MKNQSKEYVELDYTYSFGLPLPSKLHPDMLPDTYLSHNPIELQEVYYMPGKTGYRNAYSYRPTMEINFNAEHFSSPLAGKLHKHDYFEIIINLADSFEMQVESQLCNLNKWDVCFLNRSTRHSESFHQETKLFYLAISVDYLQISFQEGTWTWRFPKEIESFLSKGLRDTFQQNRNYLSFTYVNPLPLSPICKIVESIRKEFQEKQPGYPFVIRGYLHRFFYILTNSQYYRTDYFDFASDDGFSLALAAKQLMDRTCKKMTKADIASELNYNGEYINRVFKKHYGYTIPEYNRKICLQQAAELLRDTNQTASEICKTLGFSNRTAFYHLFGQEYKCTPAEFRKDTFQGVPPRQL